MEYTYHAMAMHLHADNQQIASFESHMYNAAELGMHYIRFTGHDTRTGPKEIPCNKFDFKRGKISYNDAGHETCGWEDIIGDPSISFDGEAMLLSSSTSGEDYTVEGVGFVSSGKRHTYPLAGDVTLTIGIHTKTVGESRVIIDVELSQRPPDHTTAHLRYVFRTSAQPITSPHTAEILLLPNDEGLYRLPISEDVQRDGISEIVGGLDNAFIKVSILLETRNGGYAACRVHSFEIEHPLGFQDVIERQRVIADEVGKKYGICPFVTTEISAAGQHKNILDTAVPVIDYQKNGYRVSHMDAVSHVKIHSGIFTYNHPFEKYKRTELSQEEIAFIVQHDAAAFIASKVWGATCMEVGFIEGRSGFGLNEHLRLWDLLSMAGVFITGYGDSDSHNSKKGWFNGNNFVAWTAAPANMPFPIPESEFIASLKAGRVYTGDPVFLKSPVNFTSGDLPMGAVIPVDDEDKASREMCFSMISPDAAWTMCVTNNGETVHEHKVGDLLDAEGNLVFRYEVSPDLPVNFSRVELYNADGRCILLTNPIYLVRTAEFTGEIPSERLY